MATCAQTNLQLYNQLYDTRWSAADLAAARTVYELDVQLFAGRFRPNGKPFVAHLVVLPAWWNASVSRQQRC